MDLNLTEAADYVGVSRQHLLWMAKTNKVTRKADGTFDSEILSREIKTAKKKSKEQHIELSDDALNEAIKKDKIEQTKTAFLQARAAKEMATAELKRLEMQRQRGELISKEEVKRVTSDIASSVIQRLTIIPSRVAPLCENMNAQEIEELLMSEINSAIQAVRGDWIKTETDNDE